jgi:hypothetical protein
MVLFVLEKKLSGWIENGRNPKIMRKITLPDKKIRRILTHLSIQEPDQWLKAELPPALHGPHSSRLWGGMLKSLLQVGTL